MATADTMADLNRYAARGEFENVVRPRIVSLNAPRSSRVDEPVVIAWRTQGATTVTLFVHGVAALDRVVPAVGRITLQPHTHGRLQISLRGVGQADAAGQPMRCEENLESEVLASPVRLTLNESTLIASPGETVRLHWSAEGAARVLLLRRLRAQSLDAPARGAVDLTMDIVQEAIELIAIGPGGARAKQICTLRPTTPARTGVALDLHTAFTQPLEDLHGFE